MYQNKDIEKLEDLTELAFELIDGQVFAKESSFPLSDEQIAVLFSQNYTQEWLLNTIPMASINHKRLISELQSLIYTQLAPIYCCYGEGCEVEVNRKYISFRKPDITISVYSNEKYKNNLLTNPISVIEVLSPSTQEKDLNEKKEEYFKIASLQEYILVSQDLPKIRQFVRDNKNEWTMKIYDSKDQTCIMTVGVKISLEKLYNRIV